MISEDWRLLSQGAIYHHDPYFRTRMRDEVCKALRANDKLPQAAIEWLLFVLEALGEDLPSRAKGRPVDEAARLTLSWKVVDFLIKKENLDLPLEIALERAAQEANKSISVIRKLYYSDRLQHWRAFVSRKRANHRRNLKGS